MNKRIKKNLIIGIIFFIIYLILGVIITYKIGAYNSHNYFFGADTFRAFMDLTCEEALHYRISVHPLFLILIMPFISLLTGIIRNPVITVVVIQSILGALNVSLLSFIFDKFNVNKYLNIVLIAIYGFSFTQFIFVSTPETFLFAASFLLLFWSYIVYLIKDNKNIGVKEYIILALLGTLCFGVTLTNYMQFVIGILALIIIQKEKIFKKIIMFIKINIMVVVIVVSLAWIQHIFYPRTPIFTDMVKSFIDKEPVEETNYINTEFNAEKVVNVAKTFFGYNFIAPTIDLDGKLLTFSSYNSISAIIIILFGILVLVGLIYALYRAKGKNIILIGLLLTLIGNFVLHLIYGSNESFIYSQHFTFLIVLIIGIASTYIKFNGKQKYLILLPIVFLLVEIISNITEFIRIIQYSLWKFNVENFLVWQIIFFIIISIALIALITYLIIKIVSKYKIKGICIVIAIIMFLIISSLFVKLNDNYINRNKIELSAEFKTYASSMNEYYQEYNNFIDEYVVQKYEIECSDFFLFGMGNREKYLYKDGELINIKTQETIYKFEVEKEIILPHRYMVVIYTKNNKYIKIYENDRGVYIKSDNTTLVKGTDNYIELYDFEGQKYPNVKKVLYHEILINILDSKPLPNFMAYDSPWYRDAAYVGMVLKNTDNIDLIKEWILSIENIYDYQNSGVAEADNLGELLYLISLVSDKENPLVEKVLKEAEKITKEDDNGKYIEGTTDFGLQATYQTAFLKLGLDKLGISNNYNMRKAKGSYSSMVWWYWPKLTHNKKVDDNNYPYLGWATNHKNKNEIPIYIGKIYPLTWEKNATSAKYENMEIIDEKLSNNRISPLHSWHAAEVLLFLLANERLLNI